MVTVVFMKSHHVSNDLRNPLNLVVPLYFIHIMLVIGCARNCSANAAAMSSELS